MSTSILKRTGKWSGFIESIKLGQIGGFDFCLDVYEHEGLLKFQIFASRQGKTPLLVAYNHPDRRFVSSIDNKELSQEEVIHRLLEVIRIPGMNAYGIYSTDINQLVRAKSAEIARVLRPVARDYN